jgi:hypothetical protein
MPFATEHNGGGLQANFWFLQIGNEFPFINHMKTSQGLALSTTNASPPLSSFDTDGYCTTPSTTTYTVLFIPLATDRPGNWVVRAKGQGTITFNSGGTLVSGSNTATNGNLRFVITLGGATGDGVRRIDIRLANGASGYLNDVVLMHEDDEAAYDAGEVFSPLLKQRIQEGGIGVLRMLDWQAGNLTNVSTWASANKPLTYHSYHNGEIRPNWVLGTTSGGGNAYTIPAPGFVLSHGVSRHVIFHEDATSNVCTLDIGGTGAIRLADEYGRDAASGNDVTFDSANWPKANAARLVVYDAHLNRWLMTERRIANGVPFELMLRLCAETGCHPWFVQPYLSADPPTDYAMQMAAYCKTYAEANAPWMTPFFEGPNETWNFANGFLSTRFAWVKGLKRWGSLYLEHDWYGMVMSQYGQAISAVYGNDRSKYRVVCGVQIYGSTTTSQPRLTAARWVTDGGQPAHPWVTHVAPANYFSAANPDEVALALQYEAATTDVERQTIAETYALAQNSADIRSRMISWAAFGAAYNLGMCFYEGGWSPDYPSSGENQAQRRALRKASKNTAVVLRASLLNYDNCIEVGGIFPSCYMIAGGGAAWSHMDPTIYQNTGPMWKAMELYRQNKRRMRIS